MYGSRGEGIGEAVLGSHRSILVIQTIPCLALKCSKRCNFHHGILTAYCSWLQTQHTHTPSWHAWHFPEIWRKKTTTPKTFGKVTFNISVFTLYVCLCFLNNTRPVMTLHTGNTLLCCEEWKQPDALLYVYKIERQATQGYMNYYVTT